MAKTYKLGLARTAANVVMTWMIRAGVGPHSSFLLTTTGRRSGVPRTTPVTVLESNGERWLVAPYGNVGWVYNARANSAVSLRRGRHGENFTATVVEEARAAPILKQYVTEVPITAPFFDARAGDPEIAFFREATRHPVFRLVPQHEEKITAS